MAHSDATVFELAWEQEKTTSQERESVVRSRWNQPFSHVRGDTVKLVRSTFVQTLAVLLVLLAVAGVAQASSLDSSSSSGDSSGSSPTTPAATTPTSSSDSTPSTDTTPTAPTTSTSTDTAPPTTTTSTDVPTAPSTTTTTDTPTTPGDTPDTPDVVDCTDTPTAADCIPVTSDNTIEKVPATTAAAGGSPELPFTGPGDVAIALLIALLAAVGGTLLVMGAGSKESLESLNPRGMNSTTGFRVAYRDLLKRQIGNDLD